MEWDFYTLIRLRRGENPYFLKAGTSLKRIAPGVWEWQVGTPESHTLLTAAGPLPSKPLDTGRLPDADCPFPDASLKSERLSSERTVLRFPLAEGETIYGLGLDFSRLKRNKSVVQLHSDAWSDRNTTGRTHAPIPFYLSSRGYAVLIDSARYLTFYVGTAIRRDSAHPPVVYDRNTQSRQWKSVPDSDAIEVLVPAAGARTLIFGGPNMLEAVRRYILFTGGGCLPPKWGLGFTHRTPTLYTADQVLAEAEEFEKRGFPLDFIGLEPGWHSHSYPCSFEWDNTRFPDPQEFVRKAESAGLRLNLWFNPYVAPGTPLGQRIEPHCGTHTVWNGLVPDFTESAAREIFGDHLREKQAALGPGIGGFKIDEVDGHDQWLWPDTARFPSGHDAEQLRQTYGTLAQRTTKDVFRTAGRRTYGLARGTNAGASSFPYVLYSDSYSFEGYLAGVCSSGLIGALWCPEVRGAKTPEEWARRIQLVCLSPMGMLNAWASGTKPWSFPEVADSVRSVMRLRTRLLPYLYTTFARYHFEGIPPIRPMILDETFTAPVNTSSTPGTLDDTHNPYAEAREKDIVDQFLLGEALLVAPLAPGQKERTVVLPTGGWYDFYTGTLLGTGPTVATVHAELDHIPLLVRDGGIIPLIPERRRIPAPGETVPLEIRHYGQKPSETRLYDDDGESFAFENGEYSWTRLVTSKDEKGEWSGKAIHDGPTDHFSYDPITWRFL